MAWLKSHQELSNHPKMKKLARVLGINKVQAIGHLHMLWWWALDFAKDGDLSKYDHFDIADAAEWEADQDIFVNALLESGFLERGSVNKKTCSDENKLNEKACSDENKLSSKRGTLYIHDWDEYGGKLIANTQKDTERKRKQRETKEEIGEKTSETRNVTRDIAGTHANVLNMPNHVTLLDIDIDKDKELESTNYMHVADQSVVEIDPDDQDATDLETAPDGTGSVIKAVKRRSTYPDEFEEFWEIYPRRIEKTKAFRVWNARRKDGFTSDELSAAARHYAMQCQRDRRDDSKIKYAATFLGPDRAFEEYTARAPTETTKASTNALDAVFQVAQGLNGGGFD